MNMIERVATAISGAPFPSKSSLRKARAAIEAMRDPTEGMKAAWLGPEPWDQDALKVWQAMIDAALSESAQ